MQQVIGGRYAVEETLGKGGMGVVYRVTDLTLGNTVALKQVRLPADSREEAITSHFAHEYHTLSQLAHPRVVAVYDYGIEGGEPYYTMELLGGHDLRRVGKVSWRRACELLRDVCSALQLLHARRLVHRDVTPRNIRVAPDGRAKLFDFGAMAPFGHGEHVVGTPPFVAPETLRRLPLDGRTDLFALGAVGYWLLTGQHAYPTNHVSTLEMLWETRLREPSSLAEDIPHALEDLVVGLLSLDPQGRPPSAADVMYRLETIRELPHETDLAIAQAYLSTPKLVGRDQECSRSRAALTETGRGQGLLVSGQDGTGRSRLIDQLALDGKLAGRHVLQLNAAALPRKRFAGARKLLVEVLGLAGARNALDSALWESVTGLAEGAGTSADPSEALLAAVECLAADKPTLVLIDDLEHLDDASNACLIQVAALLKRSPVVLAIAYNPDKLAAAPRVLVAALAKRGTRLKLAGLEDEDTLQLLRSVFGEVAHLRGIAQWAHRVGEGLPKVTMELAQHLVDSRIARFELGRWTLPEDLSGLALPDSIEAVLRSRIAALGAAAREVGQTLSVLLPLSVDAPPVGAYEVLFGDALTLAEVFEGLDELMSAGILMRMEDRYAFASTSHGLAFAATLDTPRRQLLHARIGGYYLTCDGAHLRAAYHMWQAGEEDRAFELMSRPLPYKLGLDSMHVRTARSRHGLQLIHWGIDHMATGQPAPERCAHAYSEALALAAGVDPSLVRCAPAALARLVHDSGRDLFDTLAPATPQGERVERVMEAAHKRWEATPVADRGLPPKQGIDKLALALVMLGGAYRRMLDVQGLRSLATLVEPWTAIPAIEVVHRTTEAAIAWSRGCASVSAMQQALDLLAEPLPGFGAVIRFGVINVLNHRCGLEEALNGQEAALARAQHLVGQPVYPVLGWDVRVNLYRTRGMGDELTHALEQRALAAMRYGNSHLALGVPGEIATAVHTDDLMALNSLLARAEAEAERYSGWRPVYLYARGCRRLMTGDAEGALKELETACRLAPIGEHPFWLLPFEGRLRALLSLGATSQATTIAGEVESEVQRRGLEPNRAGLFEMALALCEAADGQQDAACGRLRGALARLQAEGCRGLPLGLLHESLARVHGMRRDRDAARRSLGEATRAYGSCPPPAQTARHARLLAATERLVAQVDLDGSGSGAIMPGEATLSPLNAGLSLDLAENGPELEEGLRGVAGRLGVPAVALFVHGPAGFEFVEQHGKLSTATVGEIATALDRTALSELGMCTFTIDDELPVSTRSQATVALTTTSGEAYEALPLPLAEPEAVLVVPARSRANHAAFDDLLALLSTSAVARAATKNAT